MQPKVECPYCSYPLLCHVRQGKPYWFCTHCYQEAPFGIDQLDAKRKTTYLPQEEGAIAQPNPSNEVGFLIKPHLQVQRQSAQLQKEQEKLNHLKEDFLSTTSHELRTPLSNMRMSIQMLDLLLHREGLLSGHLDDLESKPAGIANYLTILRTECEREIDLINSLLLLQQIEAKTYLLLPSKIPLRDWLLQMAETFKEDITNRKRTLQVDIPANLPPLNIDLTLLNRLLTELLSNACKFTPAKEQVRIFASTHAGFVRIQICNTGIALSPTELTQIFERFYRIPNDDPWSHGGTGIGLALAKCITTYLGGDLWAESHAGQTCFTVELPCQASVEPTRTDVLMSYVAYYIIRGKQIVSPRDGFLPFEGTVYQYWGFHRDFLEYWRQLQQRRDFADLYLRGDIYSFGEFLVKKLTISECARCRMPTATSENGLQPPGCPCTNLCEQSERAQLQSTISDQSLFPSLLHFLAIGPTISNAAELSDLLQLNGFEATFANDPDALISQSFSRPVDLVLIYAEISEEEAMDWATTVHLHPQLENVPIIALGSRSPNSLPWTERTQTLEDLVLTPLGGDRIAQHLRQVKQTQTTDAPVKLHWFPR